MGPRYRGGHPRAGYLAGAAAGRIFSEVHELAVASGGRSETFAGLAGMGDLIATCISNQSRNRYVGEQLGKGRSIDEIIAEVADYWMQIFADRRRHPTGDFVSQLVAKNAELYYRTMVRGGAGSPRKCERSEQLRGVIHGIRPS